MERRRRVNVTLELTTEPSCDQVHLIQERMNEAIFEGVIVTGWIGVADVPEVASMLSEAERELGELNALADPSLRFASRPTLEVTDDTNIGVDAEPVP
jgi:hypothetical protein